MSALSVIGLCHCDDLHAILVPDESEVGFQKILERVVCGKCSTTVEDLKLVGSASFHGRMKYDLGLPVT